MTKSFEQIAVEEKIITLFAKEGLNYDQAERALEGVKEKLKQHAMVTAEGLLFV